MKHKSRARTAGSDSMARPISGLGRDQEVLAHQMYIMLLVRIVENVFEEMESSLLLLPERPHSCLGLEAMRSGAHLLELGLTRPRPAHFLSIYGGVAYWSVFLKRLKKAGSTKSRKENRS